MASKQHGRSVDEYGPQPLFHVHLKTYPKDYYQSQSVSVRPAPRLRCSPSPKGCINVLYPTLSPVRTAPAGPDTAGGPPASAAEILDWARNGKARAAARQHRLEVASGG